MKALLSGRASVRVQLPIPLVDSEPEPDIAIVRIDPGFYGDRHPGVADILLVIEIADSTLEFDRSQKALIYAQAGIADYWVLDVVGRQTHVLRQPTPNGYRSQQVLPIESSLAPIALPDIIIPFAELYLPA